jgi:hypothetical protein
LAWRRKQPKPILFSAKNKSKLVCLIQLEARENKAIRSIHYTKLMKYRRRAKVRREERVGGSAHGLFGDDAELAAGVAAAAGELERGVAGGHAAAQDDVHERAPHPLAGFLSLVPP